VDQSGIISQPQALYMSLALIIKNTEIHVLIAQQPKIVRDNIMEK